MRPLVALLAGLSLLLVPVPAYAADGCTVTPNPVVWSADATYTITAQLRPYGWYSTRIDRVGGDTFGHHAEGAPSQLDATGWYQRTVPVVNGPRDSVFPGDRLRVHIRPVDGTGGGGARCEFTVVG